MTTTTEGSGRSTRTTVAWNRVSTTTGRVSASVAPPSARTAFKATTTTKPPKRPKGSRSRGDRDSERQIADEESAAPVGPWLPGYRPLDAPDLGDGEPPPERPAGLPTGAAVADQDGTGPSLTSPMAVLAIVPLGALALTAAWTAFTRRRRHRF